MVKLLRLTTENDGKFNADLDAGIPVGADASIAVQNLTFRTIFDVLDVNDTNNDITVQWNATAPASSIITSEMDMKNYDITNADELFDNVQDTLNGTQGVVDPSTGLTNEQDNYAEFTCAVNQDNEATEIDYKLSPLSLPFHMNEDASLRSDEDGYSGGNTLWGINQRHDAQGATTDSLTVTNLKTDNGLILGNVFQSAGAGEANTAEYKNFTFPSDECGCLSRGAGVFFCNVAALADNGQAADTNGFAIGLSFTDLKTVIDETEQKSLPATARDFEIRIRRPADVYQFCIPSASGTLVNAPNSETPFYYNATQGTASNASHDLMMIERIYDDIVGSILNIDAGGGGAGTAGNKNEIFRYSLDDTERGKKLYPYIACFATGADAIVGHPAFTPLVIEERNMGYDITGREQILNGVTPANFDAYALYKDGYGTYTNTLPTLDNAMIRNGQLATQNLKLTINKEILHTLGYTSLATIGFTPEPFTFDYPTTDISALGENTLGFTIKALQEFTLQNSDNYSVMLDSNPLMSYDASKFDYSLDSADSRERPHRGRRLNILATIPVNNNTDGIVEFDANELVYIDLDNNFPQTIKNLRLRILDKAFNEIRTAGTSVLTLLVKDK